MLAVILPSLSHAFADRYFGELISGICERARKLNFKSALVQNSGSRAAASTGRWGWLHPAAAGTM